MEEIDLSSPAYWESPGVDIRLNPRLALGTRDLSAFVRSELGLDAAVVFATSGSTGSGPKFVVLEKRAILASAESVNRHLEISKTDRWLCALTTSHVGGLGVWARARKAGCHVVGMDREPWDKSGKAFTNACRDQRITLTALTPTHLYDLVASRLAAPESLRAVLIGGAALQESLLRDAINLGWPILRTFGMTEASSQIATDPLGRAHERNRSEILPVLSGWEARTGDEERLKIRGDALFNGYAVRDPKSESWMLEEPFTKDGFFVTDDRVQLNCSDSGETEVTFLGRSDDQVKKLGERVSLVRIRELLRECLSTRAATVVAMPHERKGNELVAVIEGSPDPVVAQGIDEFQDRVAPFERIDRIEWIDRIPRTGIGKIAHGQLAKLLSGNDMK